MRMPRQITKSEELEEIFSVKQDEVNRKTILDWFGNSSTVGEDGKRKVKQAKYIPEDVIVVPKGQLPNVHKDIQSTLGRYFWNMFLITPFFGDLMPYMNERLDNKRFSSVVVQPMVDIVMSEKVKPDAMGYFHNRLMWLKPYTSLFMMGSDHKLLVPSDKILKKKKELIDENKHFLESGDYIRFLHNVEGPLLEADKLERETSESFRVYGCKKPSFGNNYKNTRLMVGPIEDITGSGGFHVSTSSLIEGIPPEEFTHYANTLIKGSHARGVQTQEGGAMTKQSFSAFQTVKFEPNSDCGAGRTLDVKITKSNADRLLYCFIMEGGEKKMLDHDNLKRYVGKTVKLRTPIFCEHDDYCNVCIGDLFRRLGIDNVGLTAPVITTSIMNMAMKSMHDASIKTSEMNVMKYMN